MRFNVFLRFIYNIFLILIRTNQIAQNEQDRTWN